MDNSDSNVEFAESEGEISQSLNQNENLKEKILARQGAKRQAY
jgi:hypothetical protein